ncbi:MAG TPA: Rrf2 family transcriptional regulator [Candidatus Saccharimonadales bacterium]|jgi:Rrf2 family nitric oxide-sensitive transcriptional repressor|nr:Rrf2 family transcriptional regulator [Candidatus Saccharimonadales bacterium]
MKLTLFSDYSLRILMFASLRGDVQLSVTEVAKVYGISKHHTAKAVNFLAQRGYLRAQRGRGGGIRLGRETKQISIGQLVRQTETGSPLLECFDAASNTCPLIHACLLKQALGKADAAFFHASDGYTLTDLVHKPTPLRRALEINA